MNRCSFFQTAARASALRIWNAHRFFFETTEKTKRSRNVRQYLFETKAASGSCATRARPVHADDRSANAGIFDDPSAILRVTMNKTLRKFVLNQRKKFKKRPHRSCSAVNKTHYSVFHILRIRPLNVDLWRIAYPLYMRINWVMYVIVRRRSFSAGFTGRIMVDQLDRIRLRP